MSDGRSRQLKQKIDPTYRPTTTSTVRWVDGSRKVSLAGVSYDDGMHITDNISVVVVVMRHTTQ